jgi:hypothetical protein
LEKRSALLLMLVVAAALFPKALKAQGTDKIPVRTAAEWIKTHSASPSPVVMCNEPRAAYYAGGKHVPIPSLTYGRFVQFVQREGVDYLIFREREVREGKEFIEHLQPDHFRRVPLEIDSLIMFEVLVPREKERIEG